MQTASSGQKAHPLRKVSILSGLKEQQHATASNSHAEGSNTLAGTASDNDACFNMVNFILGAGVLGYPFCYKACGLVLTTLLILICLIAAQLSMRLLLVSSHISGKRTYEDLAKTCFGKVGQRVMGTCVFMLNLGALIAYVNILADVLSSVAGSIIPPGAEPSRNMVMTGQSCNGSLIVTHCAQRQQTNSKPDPVCCARTALVSHHKPRHGVVVLSSKVQQRLMLHAQGW